MAVIDSNIIIYAAKPENGALRKLCSNRKTRFSAISKAEVLGFHSLTPKDQYFFEKLFATVIAYPINQAVIDEATFLRQKHNLGLGDALIDATCLLFNEDLSPPTPMILKIYRG